MNVKNVTVGITTASALVCCLSTAHAETDTNQTKEPLASSRQELAGQAGASAVRPFECEDYNRFATRAKAVIRASSVCETISPSLGGAREALAQHGVGFYGSLSLSYQYDLNANNAEPQLYNGQKPTYRQSSEIGLTYDLTRLGWGGDAQLTFEIASNSGSYPDGNPNYLSMSMFTVNQRFLNDQLEVQYGYVPTIRMFYGMVLGGNSSSAALGPSSVIPVQLGLSLFSPSPMVNIRTYDANKQWYNSFAVARSASPNRFEYDLDNNPTGFKLNVSGSRPVFINEVGYKIESSENQRSRWLRAGGIYNKSDHTDYVNGGKTDDNYGGYVAYTQQLTQPDGVSPRGLYGDLKFNYAPADRNLYARDVQATAFYLGPFDNRQSDMAALGFTKSFFSDDVRNNIETTGGVAAEDSTAVSFSYAAKLLRGVYLVNGLTYQTSPTFSPESSDALLWQTSLRMSF